MALTALKGKALGEQKVVIERGPVKVFAQALLDDDPVYTGEAAPAPPTFPFVMPYWGSMGQGGAAGLPIENLRGKGRAILHGEQEFVFHDGRWPHVGDVLVGDGVDLRRVREGTLRRRQARVLRHRDDVEGREVGRSGRHHQVHARRSCASPTRPIPSRSRSRAIAMAYTPEQLSDRAEILDVVDRYALVDRHHGLGRARHVLRG